MAGNLQRYLRHTWSGNAKWIVCVNFGDLGKEAHFHHFCSDHEEAMDSASEQLHKAREYQSRPRIKELCKAAAKVRERWASGVL